MDQPPDHGTGDRLGHRPARRHPLRPAPRRIALAQHPLRRRDQDAIGARRAGKEMVQRLRQSRGRRLRRLDRIAVSGCHAHPARPSAGRSVSAQSPAACAGRARMLPYPGRAITEPETGFAEIRIGPGDRDTPVGIVLCDGDLALALQRPRNAASGAASRAGEPARRYGRPPAEMSLCGLAVEPADVAHVGHPLGREIDRTLAQVARRGVADDRIGQPGPERRRRFVESRFDGADRGRAVRGRVRHRRYSALRQ